MQAPPRFVARAATRPSKRQRREAAAASGTLAERIAAFTAEGVAFPRTSAAYDPDVPGCMRELGSRLPFASSQCGGVYWVLESELSKRDPRWKGAPWLEAMTLRPAEAGRPSFGGPTKGWDIYYTRESAKHNCDWIGLPRFFGMSHLGPPEADSRREGAPMRAEACQSFTWGWNKKEGKEFEARPPQKVALERVMPCLRDWGGTTIEMACGEGKSSLSTRIATLLGRRTLVVVPTRGLIVQWKGALAKHCPGATVGELREKYNPRKHDAASECDFVVTTSRSMSTVDYPVEMLHKFGTVIVDESHEIASRTLSQLLPRLPARYIIGLTATPARRDGLGYALFWLMGPCVFRYQRIPRLTLQEKTITVRQVLFTRGDQRIVNARWDASQIMWTDTMRCLSEDAERNDVLLWEVSRLMMGSDGRLGKARDRVAVLTLFCTHARHIGELAVREFGFPEDSVKVVVGDMPQEEQTRKLEDPKMRLLVGTVQLLGKGFDDPRLDCIVLALPMGSKGDRLQQAVGRTERVLAGKAKPLVIDLVDTFGPFENMGRSRRAFYKRFGWEISSAETERTQEEFLERSRSRQLDTSPAE